MQSTFLDRTAILRNSVSVRQAELKPNVAARFLTGGLRGVCSVLAVATMVGLFVVFLQDSQIRHDSSQLQKENGFKVERTWVNEYRLLVLGRDIRPGRFPNIVGIQQQRGRRLTDSFVLL